ncbi:hypothetical protein HPB52_000630 [Rhipicephalus sanguineus]|uniref:Uncharacterized protein n=1 Tax=Rhipicephalus sanguineus TaxID=34632 RepID=A0A9D4T6R4_RHISA|nr:hypothetical protein HPB52_000630 [Rhipicephalus sanguineus]
MSLPLSRRGSQSGFPICHLSGEDASVAVRAPHVVGATVPDELRLRHAVPLLRHLVQKLLRQRFSRMTS